MISMMMFLLSVFAGKQIQQTPINEMYHDVQTVSALADGMVYYQNQAIQKCWKNGAAFCAAGSVNLTNRTGSQTASGYGSGYQTVTDGSTYIATTLDAKGAVAGRTHQVSAVNSGIFAALKGMTSQSLSVGYYDQAAGGVILPDRNNEVVSTRFASALVQGQPVVYASIATAPPPVQLASLEGGGYSPIIPIPQTITPEPTSPTAVTSPPANISPPEPVSPTYTPPATVVIDPISPWAPSPVPPPPPPPPLPAPPPVPPAPSISSNQIALANAAKPVASITWGPTLIKANFTDLFAQMGISLLNSSAEKIYGFNCLLSDDANIPLVVGYNHVLLDDLGYPAGTDAQCAAASSLIELMNTSGNSFYSDNYLDLNGYSKAVLDNIHTSVHNYGITLNGFFGKSDVYFSGENLGGQGFSTTNLFGGAGRIDEPDYTGPTPGLSYEQSALVDQYVSIMTNGTY